MGMASNPGPTCLEESRTERKLDEALMETFPASDPLAVSSPDEGVAEEDEVDKALEESFPASDPGAVVQPHKK
jgi:hypothetical protein